MSSSGDLFKLVGRILIENAEAISAINNTIGKAQELNSTLGGVSEGADNTGKTMGKGGKLGSSAVWMGNMFTKITEKGVALGKYIGNTGFAYNSMMEQYETGFGVLIGSEEKAVKLLDDLWTLAADTPMEMIGLAKNAEDLLNYGIAVEKIIPMLRMLGDASLGSQKKMDGIVYAFGQINAYDALRGQETMQLIENGFPILEMLEKTMGATKADLLDMREKGNISFQDVLGAFEYATSEGRYAESMEKYATTFDGQKAKLADNFAQTIGNLTLSFFEMSKSNVIPKLNESLEKFGTWISNNKETLEKMAETVGQLVTTGFDKIIQVGTWLMENGEATKTAILGIATALTIGAIAAHPYATAIMAVVAGLAMLRQNNADGDAYNHFFDGYSDEDLATLQAYVDAVNRYREAEAALARDESNQTLIDNFIAAGNAMEDASKKASAIDGLIAAYNAWRSGQAENVGGDMYLDVPLKVTDGSEANMQAEIDGYDMEGVVRMLADTSGLQSAINATGLSAYVNLIPSTAAGIQVDGSHASGLDRVPRDGYIARLHKDETVLNSTQAAAWRSGSMGNTGRMEALLGQMMTIMQQVAANTAGGKQVVLDSGVLVGQLAPAMDAQLGAISGRKGRRA